MWNLFFFFFFTNEEIRIQRDEAADQHVAMPSQMRSHVTPQARANCSTWLWKMQEVPRTHREVCSLHPSMNIQMLSGSRMAVPRHSDYLMTEWSRDDLRTVQSRDISPLHTSMENVESMWLSRWHKRGPHCVASTTDAARPTKGSKIHPRYPQRRSCCGATG